MSRFEVRVTRFAIGLRPKPKPPSLVFRQQGDGRRLVVAAVVEAPLPAAAAADGCGAGAVDEPSEPRPAEVAPDGAAHEGGPSLRHQ